MHALRTRWAAFGAVAAISLGAGGIGIANAVIDEGPKPVFVPITPCRIMDTRTASDFNTGPRATPLGVDETYVVDANDDATNGNCTGQIPAEAVGLVMNATITDNTADTFITVFPTDEALPDASNLNALAGKAEPTPNLVTTDLSADGEFSVYNLNGTVNFFADVAGYYEDHNHDDRYFTEAESDARYATEDDLLDFLTEDDIADFLTEDDIDDLLNEDEATDLFNELNGENVVVAFVNTNADGDVTSGTDGITVARNSEGNYTFTVDETVFPEDTTLDDCAITSQAIASDLTDLEVLLTSTVQRVDDTTFNVFVEELGGVLGTSTDSDLATTIICNGEEIDVIN